MYIYVHVSVIIVNHPPCTCTCTCIIQCTSVIVYTWIVIIHFDYCILKLEFINEKMSVLCVINADLLHRVVQHESSNKMSQSNLTSLFGPTLMSVDGDPVSTCTSLIDRVVFLICYIMLYPHTWGLLCTV